MLARVMKPRTAASLPAPLLACALACAFTCAAAFADAAPPRASAMGRDTTHLAPAAVARDSSVVTYVIVRHAEKDTTAGASDPPLTAAGEARARALARVLADARVTRIYATPTRRAMRTGEPLARAIGDSVRVVDGTAELMRRLRTHQAGDVVVVIGHSNTVPEIAKGLCGDSVPAFRDDEFDRMLVIVVPRSGGPILLALRYGDP
jgi:probable phosphoglycerate mutase